MAPPPVVGRLAQALQARVGMASNIPLLDRRKFLKLGGGILILSTFPIALPEKGIARPRNIGGLTPNSEFYVTSWRPVPIVDARAWTLKIHGLVERPITLTFDDVRQLPAIEETLTLECVSNPPNGQAIGNAKWTGIALRPLLERVGVKRNATYAALRAADGYYTGVPLEDLMRPVNFMPYQMNGAPLPPPHGYPLRIFIPGKYGFKQPKWLTEIEFVDRPFIGYFEAQGWSNDGWRKVNSGLFYPDPGGQVDPPYPARSSRLMMSVLDMLSLTPVAAVKTPITIAGWALAGPAGIKRVLVSADDGSTWNDAAVASDASPYVWSIWRYTFAPASPGEYILRVKAIDGNGVEQPANDRQLGAGLSRQARLRLDVDAVA
jgi:DMSO/TMAO reductase YedYZ molybdopterin-dependent catalytic subunit